MLLLYEMINNRKMVRIDISELLSNDIRSRANANIIRSAIDGAADVVLDFAGVVFVSRSFMDEIYNVVAEHKDIKLENMSNFVETMYDAVKHGRQSKRILPSNDSEIKVLTDLNSLETFFATI